MRKAQGESYKQAFLPQQAKSKKLLASVLQAARRSMAGQTPRGPDTKKRKQREEAPYPTNAEVPDHPHKNSKLQVTKFAASPAQWGMTATIQKVFQAQGEDPTYWVIAETASGKAATFRCPASWCTLESSWPAHPTAPAPLRLDGRDKATREWLEATRRKVMGSSQPGSVQPGRNGEYAEIVQLTVLLDEIVERVPVAEWCRFFGPEQVQAWNQPELDAINQDTLREAFQAPHQVGNN